MLLFCCLVFFLGWAFRVSFLLLFGRGRVFFFLLFGRGPRPRPNRKKKKKNAPAQTANKKKQTCPRPFRACFFFAVWAGGCVYLCLLFGRGKGGGACFFLLFGRGAPPSQLLAKTSLPPVARPHDMQSKSLPKSTVIFFACQNS